ncbi:MAG: AtzH-like domain-containing protein [Rhodospirillaceae bacterium]
MDQAQSKTQAQAQAQAAEQAVKDRFDAYERALNSNDVPALIDFFWDDPQSIRLGPDGGAYGFAEIAAFRKGRAVEDIQRDLTKVAFTVLSPDIVVATAEYKRHRSGRLGGQSQVWLQRDGVWRIINAHVSLRPA